ncbi:unnamed protein product [Brachionus calyciflorus]|uniref:Phospholipid scramblase n=1 Tax=Brachionus calyciflorus TaxID=104777 RepID=A0A813YBM5_9BILA|nr:unnamed protein product [Brachionus calyciflorus]
MQPNMFMVNQPPPAPGQAIAWMPRPAPIPGVPPGLEYLTMLDTIRVEQIPSFLEAFTGFDTNNKYVLRNAGNQQFLYAYEDTDVCMRICCGNQRGFTFHIIDNLRQEVLTITREFKCCAGCCWFAGCCSCCAYEITVQAGGTIIGYIRQKGSFWKAAYDILDETGNTILKIEGPFCILDGPLCPFENDFKVLTADGQSQIGKITKEYAGFVREMITVADNFSITFPIDLSVKAKATLIGALFLIDFMFFEDKQKNNNNK